MPKQTPLERARELIGGTVAVAALLKVQPATVSEWFSGKRTLPEKYCPTIERATHGKVTCEELCPHVDWGYLRKPKAATA
jgi:DNA-binding transcriptional regulator YdaS (Cro superfamily)